MSNIHHLLFGLPDIIKFKIELDAIMLLKKSVGWHKIHYEIKTKSFRRNIVQDIFSIDEDGKYIDDDCGEITYW